MPDNHMLAGGVDPAKMHTTQPVNNNGRIVLIAMDHSDISKYAFEWYIKNLRQDDDNVVVVNSVSHSDVLLAPCYYTGTVPFAFDQEMLKNMLDDETRILKGRLEDLADILVHHQIKGKVKSIHAPAPGEGIIQMASDIEADIIVMGSKGHNKLRRTLFGSISDYVLHRSKVPVIVCRNKNTEKRRKSGH